MRLVIDLQGAQTASRFRGIGRYTMALTRGILRNAGTHEIWLVLNGALEESIAPLRADLEGLVPPDRIRVFEPPGRVAEIDPGAAPRCRAAELLREHFIAALAPDIVLVTSLFEGYLDDAVASAGRHVGGVRTAVILYDLIPLLNPDAYLASPHLREFYMRKVDSLKRAGLLLSISDYAREEAIGALGLDPERIVSISTAVDENFVPTACDAAELEAVRRRFGVTRAMLMCAPGGYDPRKNIFGLVSAFGLLPAALRAGHQLLIASRLSPQDRDALLGHAAACGLAGDELVLTGYVSDRDLVALYQAAALFIFPSLHEGFGLPLLEAMACGTPAIGSNSTSIPEVLGLEEAMFDPREPRAIAAKIAAVLSDPDLLARLRAHGPLQARKFSWDGTARRALRSLEAQVAATPAPPGPTRAALLDALAATPGLDADESTLVQLALCLAALPDIEAKRRVYVDIGGRVDGAGTDAATAPASRGSLRELPEGLLRAHRPGICLMPVVLSDVSGVWHYRHADARLRESLGLPAYPHAGRVADLHTGDLLMSVEVDSPAVAAAHEDGLFAHLERIGVSLYFLVAADTAGAEHDEGSVLLHADQLIRVAGAGMPQRAGPATTASGPSLIRPGASGVQDLLTLLS